MGWLILFFCVLLMLAAGGFALWRGYLASRENYLKARRWPRKDKRPRKYATGLSRKPPRPGGGRRSGGRIRGSWS